MQLHLPVDVHLAVGSDGKMHLIVGGLIKPCNSEDLTQILRGEPLKQGRKKPTELRPQKLASKPERSQRLNKNSKPLLKAKKEELSTQERAAKANMASANAVKRRRAKGQCAWCTDKPVKGKKLCTNHLVGARKVAQAARISKKKAA
jgi:hypothetical protein